MIGIFQPLLYIVHSNPITQFFRAEFFLIVDGKKELILVLGFLHFDSDNDRMPRIAELAVFEGIFDKRDDHKRYDPDAIQVAFYRQVDIEPVAKPQLIDLDDLPEVLHFAGQGYAFVFGEAVFKGITHDLRQRKNALGKFLGSSQRLGVQEIQRIVKKMRIYLAPKKGIFRHELVLLYPKLLFPGYTKLLFPPDGLHGEKIAKREKGIKEKYPETFNKKMPKMERRGNDTGRNVRKKLVPVDIRDQYIGKKKYDLP
jgi:hypothetical protein